MLNQNFFAELSELICTRISHDLIGNIGAVANAVELMDEDPEALDDAKPILSVSSKVLTARLKFFRLAFGLNNTGIKTTAEVINPTEEYVATIGSRTSPIKLNFNLSTPALYKIVMLGVMTMADVFIRGGEADFIGMNATVTERIFPQGFGRISFVYEGNSISEPARSEDGKEIPTGTSVVVLEVRDKVYIVQPLR